MWREQEDRQHMSLHHRLFLELSRKIIEVGTKRAEMPERKICTRGSAFDYSHGTTVQVFLKETDMRRLHIFDFGETRERKTYPTATLFSIEK
jgi:hypothetical protein